MKTSRWRWGVLLWIGCWALGAQALRADEADFADDLKQFEGSYQLTGANCAAAPGLTFTEEAAGADLAYHLRVFSRDGKIWNSREFRQLNGAPWYKADAGNDGTVEGRSRYGCTGAGCKLWNEHKNCSGGVFPMCSRWLSTRQDLVVFSYSTVAIYDSNGALCSYRRVP